MTDYLYLGPVPCDEECIQVSNDGYDFAGMKLECIRYKNQLLKKFGPEPEGAKLVVKTERHDVGSYYEVCVKYDENNEQAVEWAFNVENNLPAHWED